VVMTGSGFTDITAVRFGAVPATFAVVGDTVITTQVPDGAATGWLVVEKPGSVDSVAVFEVHDPPPVTTTTLALGTPWPNPSRTEARLSFALPTPSRVILTIYALGG